MSPKPICSGLVCALLLAGCGGSSHSSTTAVTHSETQPASITVSTTSAQAPSGTSSTASSSTTTHTTSRTTTHTTTHTPAAPPPVAGPRVPATFAVLSSGAISPPLISVPAGYRVQLTFVAHGAAASSVLLVAPHPVRLSVPATGEASKVVSGLPKGTYPIKVNGTTRGALTIGSAPGP